MGMSTRGPLPLLICSRGVGLKVKYHIWYYTISNKSHVLVALRYTPISAVRRTPWSCGMSHLWWCGPCLVLWVSGVIPPQPQKGEGKLCFVFKNIKMFLQLTWLKEDGDLFQAVPFFNRPKFHGRHFSACMTRNGFMLMSCPKVMSWVIQPFIEDE